MVPTQWNVLSELPHLAMCLLQDFTVAGAALGLLGLAVLLRRNRAAGVGPK